MVIFDWNKMERRNEMNVLYLDDDDEFRERFCSFMAAAIDGLAITAGTGEEYTAQEGNLPKVGFELFDLIFIDESVDLLEQMRRLGCGPKTVVLSAEDSERITVGDDGVRFVFKYQRVSSLISSVAELASAAVPSIGTRTDRKLEIILVTGFSGGCGRTSFSIMYARLLRRMMNRAAVILSAERTGDINDYFRMSADRSDVNLLLLNFSSGINVLPQRFTVKDDYGANAFVMPEDAVSDFGDLSDEMMGKFVDMTERWKVYDTLIVDLSPQLSGKCAQLVRLADKMFVLHDSRRKTHRGERAWSDMMAALCGGKVMHVKNFFMENSGNDEIYIDETAERNNDYSHSCIILHDPDSFYIKEGTADISMTGSFSESVGRIIDEV